LKVIGSRQYVDWQRFRHLDIESTEVGVAVERFCANIFEALQKTYVSVEDRRQQERAEAQQRSERERQQSEKEEAGQQAGAERKRLDAEAAKRTEEARKEERRRADEEKAARMTSPQPEEEKGQRVDGSSLPKSSANPAPHFVASFMLIVAAFLFVYG